MTVLLHPSCSYSCSGITGEEYFSYDIFTAPIIEAKLIVMDMLRCTADLQVSARLHSVYSFFDTQIQGQACTSETQEFSYNTGQLKELFKEMFASPIPHSNIVLIPNDVEPNIDEFDEDGKLTWTMSAPPDELTLKLLQLTRYESLQMQSRAFEILFRHRGQPEALVSAMRKSCPIVHPDMLVANLLVQAEVHRLRPQIKWLAYPASSNRATAVRACSDAMPRWCKMSTEGDNIDLGGKQIKVDEFFSKKLAETLFAHDAHYLAIQILELDINLIDLTSLQLRQLVEECDLDKNGNI